MKRSVTFLLLIASAVALYLRPVVSRSGSTETVTCTPTAPTINFGSYDVLGGANLDGTGSFTVTCTRSSGSGGSTSFTYTAKMLDNTATRQLAPTSGADRISYQLYTTSARNSTVVWGDGTSGTTTFTGSLSLPNNGSATSATINFYGRITGGQDVSAAAPAPPSTYSQTLMITVTCTPSPPC